MPWPGTRVAPPTNWPARVSQTSAPPRETWNRFAAHATGQPSSTMQRASRSRPVSVSGATGEPRGTSCGPEWVLGGSYTEPGGPPYLQINLVPRQCTDLSGQHI